MDYQQYIAARLLREYISLFYHLLIGIDICFIINHQ